MTKLYMKQTLAAALLLVTAHVQCRVAELYSANNLLNPKAYAKNNYSEEGTAYSCDDLLAFEQYRDGSYFEPEDWMKYYLECAHEFPHVAEAGVYKSISTPYSEGQGFAALTLLIQNKFAFSTEFKEIMCKKLTADMAKVIAPIVLNARAQRRQLPMYTPFEHEQTRPNCQQLEEFVNKYANEFEAGHIKALCELKNVLAPELVLR